MLQWDRSNFGIAAAKKRLAHDLLEIVERPIPGVHVQPIESDILEWHGNMYGVAPPDSMSSNEQNEDVERHSVHFILQFPSSYPFMPPAMHISAGLPHPNIMWSPEYSARSVLVQVWHSSE
jgi:ubiquitin-protein ligase